MLRRKIIAANWKMNKTAAETKAFMTELLELLDRKKPDLDVVICPSFTSLKTAYDILKDVKDTGMTVSLGAQNLYFEDKGAFTGEISHSMVSEFCNYVILGHSERRQLFDETNEIIAKKLFVSVNTSLSPILCVGETIEQRQAEREKVVVGNQLVQCLKNISQKYIGKVLFAYEPVWAIGTGRNATPQQAEEMHLFMREKLKELYSKDIAEKARILYGGSVTTENIKELMEKGNIDGALVGTASLDAEVFAKILNFTSL